jgi:hypothetical protein
MDLTPAELRSIKDALITISPTICRNAPERPIIDQLFRSNFTFGDTIGGRLVPVVLHFVDFVKNETVRHGPEWLEQSLTAGDTPPLNIMRRDGKFLKYLNWTIEKLRAVGENPNVIKLTQELKTIQFNKLRDLDQKFSTVNKVMTQCFTWLSYTGESKDCTISPFLTCIPLMDLHVMYCTYCNNGMPHTLNVAVGDLNFRIPFELNVPSGLNSVTVMIAVSVAVGDGHQPIAARIHICVDTAFTDHVEFTAPGAEPPASIREFTMAGYKLIVGANGSMAVPTSTCASNDVFTTTTTSQYSMDDKFTFFITVLNVTIYIRKHPGRIHNVNAHPQNSGEPPRAGWRS